MNPSPMISSVNYRPVAHLASLGAWERVQLVPRPEHAARRIGHKLRTPASTLPFVTRMQMKLLSALAESRIREWQSERSKRPATKSDPVRGSEEPLESLAARRLAERIAVETIDQG